MSDHSEAMVKLMTLINVSAAKPNRRRRSVEARYAPIKKNKPIETRSANGMDVVQPTGQPDADEVEKETQKETLPESEIIIDAEEEDASSDHAGDTTKGSPHQNDAFHYHFASDDKESLASKAQQYTSQGKGKASSLDWETTSDTLPVLGHASIGHVKGLELPALDESKPHAKTLEAFRNRSDITSTQAAMAKLLGSYKDVIDTRTRMEEHDALRRVIAMHAMSHVTKVRRRILRNNERLSKAATTGSVVEADVRDQGFTRPRVLILLPFRNSAVSWMSHLSQLSGCDQVDSASRFKADFHLPEGTVDKLAQPEALTKYPLDHVETFRGNIDDNFRLGAKLTRKSWRLYSQFYESDVIIASPLGLRLAIEKDRDSDFLSSIEILIADQLDVMSMQNWEHVEFVMEKINKIPKEAHDADFSRIKQWYLDGQAPFLRQTVLLSAYDMPELRKMTRGLLKNIAGRVHLCNASESGVLGNVRSGIRQTFQRFPCNNIQLESTMRIETFLTKTLSTLQKSALSSSRTLIFVPSYLDFVQLQEALRTKHPDILATTGILTEYSEGSEIARNRARFINERKRFLIVTERFVFYRRYILRGARTIVWFGLPDHPTFYSEMLENMFDKGDLAKKQAQEEIDVGDVSVMALYTQYDYLRLSRIVGSHQAQKMVRDEKTTWRFV